MDGRDKPGHDGGRFARCASAAEMLRELQALRLVVRADALAVERMRARQHLLVDEAPHDLPVLEDERHFARAHLEHRARAAPAGAGVAEAGIEEAGVMHAKFADQRIERHHLGGIVRRYLYRLFRSKDVELARVENEALLLARAHRLPEIADLVAGAALDVDEAGVAFGAIADHAAGPEPGEIDPDRDAFAHVGFVIVD